MIVNRNKFAKIIALITLINNLKTKNLLDIKDMTNNIINILVKEADWNRSLIMENEIITLLQNYENDLRIHFPIFGLGLHRLLKKQKKI